MVVDLRVYHYDKSGSRITVIIPPCQGGDDGSIPFYRSIDDERVIKRVSRGNTARIPQQIGRRKVNERQWRIGKLTGLQSQLSVWGYNTNRPLCPALVRNVVDSSIILWCSSEVEQGAVNSQVGISEFPITARQWYSPLNGCRQSRVESEFSTLSLGPEKTLMKLLRLERDGYSIIVLFGPFDYRLGHQVFILKRRVRLPYRVQHIHHNRSHRISPLVYE